MKGQFTLLPAGADLVSSVADLLAGREDLGACTVIFPGRRPGHFLRKELYDRLGKSFEAPAVYSMDEFIGVLAEAAAGPRPEIGELDAAALMLQLEEGFGGLAPLAGRGEKELDWFLPWALKAYADFEEIKKELKETNKLGMFDLNLEAGEGGAVYRLAKDFVKKFGGFSKVYRAFYEKVEEKKYFTPAMKYAAAARPEAVERAGLAEKGLVVMAGFFLLTEAERRMVKNLFRLANFRLLAKDGPGLAERCSFLAREGLIAAPKPYVPAPPAAFHGHKASDSHSEVFALGRVMKGKAHDAGDVIVMPSPEALFPVVHNLLPDHPENNISIGYPVSHTPVYSLVRSIGRLLDRAEGDSYFIPDYLDLVFHPYVKSVLHKSELDGSRSPELTRIVLQEVQAFFLGRMGRFVTLAGIEGDRDLLGEIERRLRGYDEYKSFGAAEVSAHLKAIHDNVVRPFERIGSLGDFAGRLLDLITFISANTTAPRHPYWEHFSGTFLTVLDGIEGSWLAGSAFASRQSYFRFFGSAVGGTVYPFEGTPVKGLQVLGLLETRGLKFKRVYFLDANADALNSGGTGDAVLSDYMRGMLGLPTCADREAARKYHFETLLAGAEEVHVFYRDNSKAEKSPFVEELLFRLETAGADRAKLEDRVFFDLNFANKQPAPAPKKYALSRLAAPGAHFSPSSINTYLLCPLQFYLTRVLGLEGQEEMTEEISRASIGNIVHRTLEHYFGARLGKPYKPADFKEELAAALACMKRALADFHLRDVDKGYGYIMRRQVEKRLEDILHFHMDRLAGFTPLATEVTLEAQFGLPSGKTVNLYGKADRVDLRPGADGREKLVIVDYKTGSTAHVPAWQAFDPDHGRADWADTLRSVQLPVYVLMALTGKVKVSGGEDFLTPALKGRGVADLDARLMLLGRQDINEESLYKEYRRALPDIPATFEKYKKAVGVLLDEILDPAREFEPTRREADCAYCQFKVMCGRQWVKE